MKTLMIALTLATMTVGFAPLQAQAAGTSFGALAPSANVQVDRRGRGCDTPHDIKEHPRCTR